MKTYTLITGASQGFGKALALECAENNMNLILVSLPQSGLMELADFLRTTYTVEVHTFEVDLSKTEQILEMRQIIRQGSLKVKYLINNAGILSKGLFNDLEWSYFQQQIQVNVMAPTLLTRLFLDDLKDSAPSGVLNVGSMACFFFLPGKSVYGATKAFLLSFSKSLYLEFKKMGVTVSILCPGGMNTNPALSYQNSQADWITRMSIQEPEVVARIAIRGMLHKKERIIPSRLCRLFMLLNWLLPKFVKNRIIRREMDHLKATQIPQAL
jgi:short-subunit dehydrogenase